jgi:hypothetical protein
MIDSVMDIFFEISSHGIFLNSINQQIQKALERCNILNSYYRFILFLRTRGFRFSELELAFDFFECMPFIGIKHSAFKKYKNSIYSSDRKIYYRKSFTEDDSYGLEKHRVRDSVFAIYNRGIKLQVPESVWRVEWRLRDERARRLLDMTDLRLNMDNYICKYSHRLRNILGNWIGPNEIVFNWDYINYSFPIFSLLTTG